MNSEEIVCMSLDNASNYNTKISLDKNESENVERPADGRYQDREYNDDISVDIMAGSYGEISLDREAGEGDEVKMRPKGERKSDDEGNPTVETRDKRPTSLVLEKGIEKSFSVGEGEEPWKRLQNKCQQTSDSQTTSLEGSPSLSSEFSCTGGGSDTSGLSELQGIVTVDGDLVSFVAEDLQEKIKMSSPVSRSWADTPSFPGSRSSTPSLYRQALQPHVPTVDAGAIVDLEVHACKVASCLDTVLENLSGTLQSISSLTVDCMETYQTAVFKTCNGVDSNIKSMYQLMAKCEEISSSMRPLYKISEEIKEIKRLLDLFENAVEHK